MSRFIRLASFSALTLTRLHINEFEIAKRRSLVCEKLMNDGSKSTSELSIATLVLQQSLISCIEW